jgi:putative endonuclease
MTKALERRGGQHRSRTMDGFTKRYKAGKLVYYESTNDVRAAIQREKEIKGWSRQKKIALIESMNPRWKDLADDE